MSKTPEISDDLDRLLDLEGPLTTDPTREVYANRNLDLATTRAIGFDMDYTLALYHQGAMNELSIRMTVEKLIGARGYPEEIREARLEHAFIVRGLMVDKDEGNIFKMDAHRHIGRCYHGYQKVPADQVRRLYGEAPLSMASGRFAWLDTLFSLPEATLLAGIIEHWEAKGRSLPWSYRKLFDDIRASIDEAHRDTTLKAEILADLPRYIVRDQDLAPTLHKLRSAGKKLFLLTNSEAYYTDAVMTFLLDGALPFYQSWRDYFDLMVVSAAKPAFFTQDRPFLRVDAEGGEAQPFEGPMRRGIVYRGGNIHRLGEVLGLNGGQILYVGDHMYSDIVRSRKDGSWATALVVQELEENIRLTHEHMDSLRRIGTLEEAARHLSDAVNYHRTLARSLGRMAQLLGALTGPEARVIASARDRAKGELERKRRLLEQTVSELESLEDEVDRAFNPYWGRLFRERNERSQLGLQVQNYAGVYTSRVSNLLAYSPDQVFRAPRDDMPHERV